MLRRRSERTNGKLTTWWSPAGADKPRELSEEVRRQVDAGRQVVVDVKAQVAKEKVADATGNAMPFRVACEH